MKSQFLILMALLGFCLSCSSLQKEETVRTPTRADQIRAKAEQYIQIYADRSDWAGFLDLFRDDMQFEDVMFGFSTHHKDTFKLFYNWEDKRFQKLSPETPTLVVTELVVNDSVAIAKGYFPDFIWNGEVMKWPDDFVICLYYDDSLKIKKQVDFVYYPGELIKETKRMLKASGFIRDE